MYINIRLDEITNIRLEVLKAKYNSNLSKIVRHSIFYLNPNKIALHNDYGVLKYRKGIYITDKEYNYLLSISNRQNISMNKIILNALNQLYEAKEEFNE